MNQDAMVSYPILLSSPRLARKKRLRSESRELPVIHTDGTAGMARVWILCSYDRSSPEHLCRLGDVINGFRMKTLHLDAISPLWGHMLLSRMKVPFTYCW